MRKWILPAAALLLTAAFLAGCGEDEPGNESSERSYGPAVHSDPATEYSDIDISEGTFSFGEISLPEDASRSEQSRAPAESSEPAHSEPPEESSAPTEVSDPETSEPTDDSSEPEEQSVPADALLYALDETRFLALDESWTRTDGDPFSAVCTDGTTLTVRNVSLEEGLSGLTEALLAEEMKARLAILYDPSELSVVSIRFAGENRSVLCVRHDGKITFEWFLAHTGSCTIVAAVSENEESARAAIRSIF